MALSLGPTRPAVDPGQPFPAISEGARVVISPLAVNINGRPVCAINALGWPGLPDAYRVDFQVPSDISGNRVSVQIVAAFMPGHAVTVPVR